MRTALLFILASCGPTEDPEGPPGPASSGSRLRVHNAIVTTTAADGTILKDQVRYIIDTKLNIECAFQTSQDSRSVYSVATPYCLPLRTALGDLQSGYDLGGKGWIYLDSSCSGQPYAWTQNKLSDDVKYSLCSAPFLCGTGAPMQAPSQFYFAGREGSCGAASAAPGTLFYPVTEVSPADFVGASTARQDQ